MNIVHLTASTMFGGPERQMLGLANALPGCYRTTFLSFAEGGRSRAFLDQARDEGHEAHALAADTPYLLAATRELEHWLRTLEANILLCHGYKADLLGRWAARRAGIPVVAVSRGWTGETFRVRCYEKLDRICLRWMDRVVCVSQGQADKVLAAGVPAHKVRVIRNTIRTDRFAHLDFRYRRQLLALFDRPVTRIVAAAGRLSPEKGFAVLIEAASRVVHQNPAVGFVIFGDGMLRADLERRIQAVGLRGSVVLAGFRDDLDHFLPFVDLLAQASYTEGLPNVVLEAFAAGVPAVATAVGGTPELVQDGVSGVLVQPGDAAALANGIVDVLRCDARRRAMGARGRQCVRQRFTFEAQSASYQQMFSELLSNVAVPLRRAG
jgi:glycosyltransferase involved in cell wall biosynthesis